MDKDRVVGTINDVVGGAKRKVGNLTGDTRTEVEGAVQQAKGKVQNTWGKVKDAARDTQSSINASHQANPNVEREHRKTVVVEDSNLT
jgi:uncharacterized protein YjbJ (UPF0337 family)